jgi:hypothetical protein
MLNEAWLANLSAGCPKPEEWYVSPFTRTADTMRLSFGDVLGGKTPVFVEGLREIFGEQTCDKRRSKVSYRKGVANKSDIPRETIPLLHFRRRLRRGGLSMEGR